MGSLTERYKAKNPPSPQVIEAYAQRIANYMNIFTEDSYYASQDPIARDSAVNALAQSAHTTNNSSPYSIVPLGADPDEYLAKVDAEIRTISRKPSLTMADRALRMHLTFSAQLVFTEYKVYRAYADWPDVYDKVDQRLDILHHTWVRDFMARNGVRVDSFQGPPTTHGVLTPPPSRHPSSSTSRLDATQIEGYLDNPASLLRAEFKCTTLEGTSSWVLASFSQDKSGIQYFIEFTDQPARIPMDIESMRLLLSESVVVTEQ